MAPLTSFRTLFFALLATSPLVAMDLTKEMEDLNQAQKDQGEQIDLLKKSIQETQNSHAIAAGNLRFELDESKKEANKQFADLKEDLEQQILTQADETSDLFAKLEQSDREARENLKNEILKTSEERYLKIEGQAQEGKAKIEELEETIETKISGFEELYQIDHKKINEKLDELDKNVEDLETDYKAQIKTTLEVVDEYNQGLEGKIKNLGGNFKKAVDDINNNAKDIESFEKDIAVFRNDIRDIKEAIGNHVLKGDHAKVLTRIDSLEKVINCLDNAIKNPANAQSFEAQLRELCVSNAQSINNPISALLPLGIYHAIDGNALVEKLVASTINPRSITELIKRALCANILNALLPKTGAVSQAKNGWAYLATYIVTDLAMDWTAPFAHPFVPEQMETKYSQMPETIQNVIPWLGKSLLAFAIAPAV